MCCNYCLKVLTFTAGIFKFKPFQCQLTVRLNGVASGSLRVLLSDDSPTMSPPCWFCFTFTLVCPIDIQTQIITNPEIVFHPQSLSQVWTAFRTRTVGCQSSSRGLNGWRKGYIPHGQAWQHIMLTNNKESESIWWLCWKVRSKKANPLIWNQQKHKTRLL